MTEQEESWDRERAQKHGNWMRIGSRVVHAPFARKIVKRLGPLEMEPTVVDLGTGPGFLCIELRKLMPQATVIGVDPSSEMIEIARRNLDEAGMSDYEMKLGRAEKIPIDSGSVDLVVTQSSLHEWESAQQGFSEIHRVLRPGGSLILKDYNRDWLSKWKRMLLKFFHHLEMFKFNFEEIVDLLTEAGFDEIEGEERRLQLFAHARKG